MLWGMSAVQAAAARKKAMSDHPLDRLFATIAARKAAGDTGGSYTATLLSGGVVKCAKKFGEESVETVIAGYIESTQPILTKNGEKMLFARIADFSSSIELVAFPRVLKENESLFMAGNCIMLKGKISERNGEPSFVVERARAL